MTNNHYKKSHVDTSTLHNIMHDAMRHMYMIIFRLSAGVLCIACLAYIKHDTLPNVLIYVKIIKHTKK
nr:hypothetical protein Itr_chr10CG04940 [Ipomoea trifida]